MGTTVDRVRAQTSLETNERLRRQMEQRLAHFEAHPDQIEARSPSWTANGTWSGLSKPTRPHWPSRGPCWRQPSIADGSRSPRS